MANRTRARESGCSCAALNPELDYGVGILRYPMRPWLELRTTLELGASY